MATKQKVPKDILNDAKSKYPKPDRSNYYTDTEYEMILESAEYLIRRTAYIQGRLDERKKNEKNNSFENTEAIKAFR